MRLRASAGLGVVDYDGFYCKRTPTDVDLPAVDCDKAVAVTLRHEEKPPTGARAYVQCALLYTTVAGERRSACTPSRFPSLPSSATSSARPISRRRRAI